MEKSFLLPNRLVRGSWASLCDRNLVPVEVEFIFLESRWLLILKRSCTAESGKYINRFLISVRLSLYRWEILCRLKLADYRLYGWRDMRAVSYPRFVVSSSASNRLSRCHMSRHHHHHQWRHIWLDFIILVSCHHPSRLLVRRRPDEITQVWESISDHHTIDCPVRTFLPGHTQYCSTHNARHVQSCVLLIQPWTSASSCSSCSVKTSANRFDTGTRKTCTDSATLYWRTLIGSES